MATGTIQNKSNLLWTNPSPNADFAAGDVSVDLSGYRFAIVTFRYSAQNSRRSTAIVPIGNTVTGEIIYEQGSSCYCLTRTAEATSTKVTFGTSYRRQFGTSGTVSGSNSYMLPQEIYGQR